MAWDKINDFLGGIVGSVKGFPGIKPPSTPLAGIGRNMGEGMGPGFEGAMKTAAPDMQNAVPIDFDLEPNIRARNRRIRWTARAG